MSSIFFQLFPNSRPDSINRKIFRAAAIVGILTVLGRIAAMSKELVVAHAFGRSDALEAFLIAYMVPLFLVNPMMSALGSALLPVLLEKQHRESEEAAERLLSSVVVATLIGLTLVTVTVGLCAPLYLHLLAHNFSNAKLLLTQKLLYLLLPWIVFSGLATLLSCIMNARERFALPALVPLATPLVTILFIVVARSQGAYALAAGTTIGGLLETVLLFWILSAHNIRLSFRWNGFDPTMRTVLSQYAPMLAGAFLLASNLVIDQSFAATLSAGSVAALSYGSKISNALLLIAGTALSAATLPYFSKMAAQSDWVGCRHTLKRYTTLITLVAVPATLLLIGSSKPIIRLLFQRGAFTPADTHVVNIVQICCCLQIPFQCLCLLFARFISAVKRNDLLLYAAVVNVVVNVVMDLVLMRIWGVAGIAASTAVMSACSAAFLAVCSLRLLDHPAPASATAASTMPASGV
jgi:putative peptidoglycan lipid II flippase